MKRESPFSRSMHSWHSRRSANIGNNFPFLLGRQTYFLSWSICFSNCWTALNGLKKKQPHILQLPKVLGSLGFLPLARQVLSFFFNSTHTTDFFSFFFSFFQKKKLLHFADEVVQIVMPFTTTVFSSLWNESPSVSTSQRGWSCQWIFYSSMENWQLVFSSLTCL